MLGITLAIIIAVLVNMSPTGSSLELNSESCPSPPVTYASKDDSVTLCWQVPPDVNTSRLTRFTVIALKRPVQLVMEKVASARNNGKFFRTYDSNHHALYKERATMDVDPQTRMLHLRMTNYSSDMENVYCVLYEMFIVNDVLKCHSHAVFLRTGVPAQIQSCTPNLTVTASEAQPVRLTCSATGKPRPRVAWYSLPGRVLLKSSVGLSSVYVTVKKGINQYLFEAVNHHNGLKVTRVITVYGKDSAIPSTTVTVRSTTSNTELTPQATEGQVEYRTASNLRTGFIVVSTVLGLFVVGVVFLLVRYRKTRRRRNAEKVRRNDSGKLATPLTACEANKFLS